MAIETDAVVVGAGPVGLFQVFELGLQALRAHVIDALPAAGGQCAALYPDKPIYDIPSVAACSAAELVERLLAQIAPFRAQFHFGRLVSEVEPLADGRFRVATSTGDELVARVIVIAGGVGAFRPRTLKVAGLDAFEGTQLFHRCDDETAAAAGREVVVVGGDDAAVDAAVAFAKRGGHAVTLLHRRSTVQAPAPRLAEFEALRASGALRLQVGQVSGAESVEDGAGARLTALEVLDAEARSVRLPADTLYVLLGLSPKLGPIADWGLALQQRQLVVDTATFQTSVPGIYAVGDVCTYPGKRRLIVCGFHEATLAAFGAAAHLSPGVRIPLEYTTASPRLHALLGVTPGVQPAGAASSSA